jgi:microcystin-dependent protein
MPQTSEILGTIKLFAGPYDPVGYTFCNGRELEIARFQALYSVIGIQYGGDGITHFALPNLQGKEPDPNLRYIICIDGNYPGRY